MTLLWEGQEIGNPGTLDVLGKALGTHLYDMALQYTSQALCAPVDE
jgi:hypothetical protein